MCVCVCVCVCVCGERERDAHCVMVTVVGNEYCDSSSNLARGRVHFI